MFNFNAKTRIRPMSAFSYFSREKCKYISTTLLDYMSNTILNNENNNLKLLKNILIT